MPSIARCRPSPWPAIWTIQWAGPSQDLTPAYKRRTVYGKVSRYKLDTYLQTFDFPSPNISAEKRFTTTVPLQRLFLMNRRLHANLKAKSSPSALRPSPTIRLGSTRPISLFMGVNRARKRSASRSTICPPNPCGSTKRSRRKQTKRNGPSKARSEAGPKGWRCGQECRLSQECRHFVCA